MSTAVLFEAYWKARTESELRRAELEVKLWHLERQIRKAADDLHELRRQEEQVRKELGLS